MTAQPLFALHESHRVGIDLYYIIDSLARQSAQHMRYTLLVLADDTQVARAEKLVVAQNAAGNGVFDSSDAKQRRIVMQRLEQFREGIELYGLNIIASEILAGGSIVETARDALYAYSYLLFHIIKNAPRLSACGALYK